MEKKGENEEGKEEKKRKGRKRRGGEGRRGLRTGRDKEQKQKFIISPWPTSWESTEAI